jgi:ATP-binding cassette subfamily B protein
VSSGEILVDEKNIKEWNLESLRTQTGYVPQDVILFSDTLHNNIAFGLKENVTQLNDVENAAEVAAVLKDIKSFKNEFETVIGERGISLSGGQKQRISIARALIKKPQMLLLDDCLSAVDTVTEETILYNLRKKLKGKTTLIFSHRISTIKYADRIIVLDKGNLVEEGTHEQLISKNGLYSKMVDEQVKQEVAENKRAE